MGEENNIVLRKILFIVLKRFMIYSIEKFEMKPTSVMPMP